MFGVIGTNFSLPIESKSYQKKTAIWSFLVGSLPEACLLHFIHVYGFLLKGRSEWIDSTHDLINIWSPPPHVTILLFCFFYPHLIPEGLQVVFSWAMTHFLKIQCILYNKWFPLPSQPQFPLPLKTCMLHLFFICGSIDNSRKIRDF